IYLHIPFCKQKCNYCNFHFSTSLSGKSDLLQALHAEIPLMAPYLEGQPIETIYFGGGTPSLLEPDELKRLFDALYSHFPAQQLKEVTLEANPDDLTTGYIKALRGTPVNRLSIGVQSFRDQDLQYMNRAHNASQADYAIKAAQDLGFTNLTIDLIYGTPGLTDQDWKSNLDKVRDLSIPHFSAYALTVEEGTLLHHAISKKKSAPVDPGQAAGQFEILVEKASIMGFEHYEISNLALPGRHAVHNTNYWNGTPYLGLGPSAHSFDGSARRWNVANNARYTMALLKEGKLLYEEENLTPVQRLNEYIMTSLRTQWGCSLERIEKTYGAEAAGQTEKSSHIFQEKKWIIQDGRNLLLTQQGKLYADKIAAELFHDEL
ncbi:MAG: radical SAM family heme chaperone HemW, partial [Sphingobacteriales bacterium]